MKYLTISIALLIFTSACSQSNKSNKPDKAQSIFATIHGTNTLKIEAYFADYGEWGGHSEQLLIYRTKDSTLMAHYTKDTVSSPDPAKADRRIIKEWTVSLPDAGQQKITNYINFLYTIKNTPGAYHGVADTYSVNNSANNLEIEYADESKNFNLFKELLSAINKNN